MRPIPADHDLSMLVRSAIAEAIGEKGMVMEFLVVATYASPDDGEQAWEWGCNEGQHVHVSLGLDEMLRAVLMRELALSLGDAAGDV